MSARKKMTKPPEKEGGTFCEGSLVEVTSDEDGYTGSWFEAQVVRQLTSPATPLRKRKKGGTFLVQYKTLLTDDCSDRLTEHVQYYQLRPLPPTVDEAIGLYDAVDALFYDGWWEGCVVRVLEESKRFSVLFESPVEHVMDFDRQALRHHLDWIRGHWVRTPKKKHISYVHDDQSQKQLATLHNSVTNVEEFCPGGSPISPDSAGNDLSSFQKEPDNSGPGNGMLPINPTSTSLASTSESGIVLLQPCKKLKSYDINTPSPFTKLPHEMLPSEIFRAALLGNIFQSARDVWQARPTTSLMIADQLSRKDNISAEKDYEVLCISDDRRQKQLTTSPDSISIVKAFCPCGGSSSGTNVGDENSFQRDLEGSHKKNEKSPRIAISTCTNLSCFSKIDVKLLHVNKLISGSIYTPLYCAKPPFLMLQSETFRALFGEVFQNPSEVQHRPTNCLMIADQPSRNEDTSSQQSEEVAENLNDIIIHSGKGKATHSSSLENTSLKVLSSSQNSFGGEVLEASEKGCPMKDLKMEIVNVKSSSSNSNPPSLNSQELELPDIISGSWILQQSHGGTGTLVDSAMKDKTSEFKKSIQPVDTDGQTLPFAKRSPLWKHIESMEAFRIYPQNPHFRPLEQVLYSCREGMAIGCMAVFVSLMEEMSKLVPDVPKSKIEDIMKGVLPLDSHGFNVDKIKTCLAQLQEFKEVQEQLLLDSEEVAGKIIKQNHVNTKTSAELENALEELKGLEEKVAKLHAVKKELELVMAVLKSKSDSVQEQILENGIHFGNLLIASCLPAQQQAEVSLAI